MAGMLAKMGNITLDQHRAVGRNRHARRGPVRAAGRLQDQGAEITVFLSLAASARVFERSRRRAPPPAGGARSGRGHGRVDRHLPRDPIADAPRRARHGHRQRRRRAGREQPAPSRRPISATPSAGTRSFRFSRPSTRSSSASPTRIRRCTTAFRRWSSSAATSTSAGRVVSSMRGSCAADSPAASGSRARRLGQPDRGSDAAGRLPAAAGRARGFLPDADRLASPGRSRGRVPRGRPIERPRRCRACSASSTTAAPTRKRSRC